LIVYRESVTNPRKIAMQKSNSIHCFTQLIFSRLSMVDSRKMLCPKKPVFQKIAVQRSYVPSCAHTTFVQLTPALAIYIIDKIIINPMM